MGKNISHVIWMEKKCDELPESYGLKAHIFTEFFPA